MRRTLGNFRSILSLPAKFTVYKNILQVPGSVGLSDRMDPAEVEFLAEKEKITIVPNFSQDKIYLIGVSIDFTKRKKEEMWEGGFMV